MWQFSEIIEIFQNISVAWYAKVLFAHTDGRYESRFAKFSDSVPEEGDIEDLANDIAASMNEASIELCDCRPCVVEEV